MIPQTSKISKRILGSSLTFSAQGGRGKEKNQKPAAKNFASPSEGEAEGGCGGNSASPEPKRSPAALLVQSRVPQKSFLFLLEEKEIARKIKNCEENFFAEQRAKRAAAGRSVSFAQRKFAQSLEYPRIKNRPLGDFYKPVTLAPCCNYFAIKGRMKIWEK